MWLLPLLPLVAAAAPIDAQATSILTSIIAEQIENEPTFDVITTGDVRRMVELEAQKQSIGCSADSCLAEVAGAMGARFVVYGDVGRLGNSLNLTVGVFDAQLGRMARRMTFRGNDADALRTDLEKRATQLVAAAVSARGAATSERTRIVVLDVAVAGARSAVEEPDAPPPPAAPAGGGPPLLGVIGGVAGGAGALAIAGGVVLGVLALDADTRARDPGTKQIDAVSAFDQRDDLALGANVLYGVGGVLAAAGTGLLIVGMMGDGE
jgi:hypothetical protein